MDKKNNELEELIQKFIEENHIKFSKEDPICAVFTMLRFFEQKNTENQSQLLSEFSEKIQENLLKIDELSISKSKKLIEVTWETTDEKLQKAIDKYSKNIEEISSQHVNKIEAAMLKTRNISYFNIAAALITFLTSIILVLKVF